MDAREYLEQVRKLDAMIFVAEEQKERLETRAKKMTTAITGIPGGGGDGRSLENNVIAIADLVEKYDKEIKDCEIKRNAILETIKKLPGDYFKILFLHYFKYQRFEEIAYNMKYSYKHICRLHRKALEKLNLLPNAVECDIDP